MKTYGFNGRFWFFLLLFTGVVVLGIRVEYMLLTNQVALEDEPMGYGFSVALGLIIGVFLCSYLVSSIVMWKQVFVHKTGLTLSEDGICRTLVFVNVLAAVIVVPVRRIPWEAVHYYDRKELPYIRVDVKQVEAGWMAKLLLLVLGYHFLVPFLKPKVTVEDIDAYAHRFVLK